MKKKRSILLLLVVALVLLTACSSDSGGEEKAPLRIIDANFSEGKLIGRMAKMLIEEHTEYEAEILDEMAPVNIYNETKAGNGDIYNSYDGTVLTTFLHLDPTDVPEDMTLYDFANQELNERDNMRMLKMLGNNNTYALAVRPDVYEKYGMETVSDLAEVSDELVFGAEHEFFTEEGSAKYGPMAEFYDLNFKDAMRVDIGLKYQAIDNGEIDCTVVYTTDGLNLQSKLKVLEDDKEFFPDYNGALVIRDEVIEEYGQELVDALNMLEGKLPNEKMVQLTYECDVNMRDVDEVAEEFLRDEGLIE